MRLANVRDRASLVVDGGYVDIETASAGAFGPDLQALFAQWHEFAAWTASADLSRAATVSAGPADLGPAVPRPGSVFAIGLNYRLHALESGLPLPEVPLVFTKFPSSVAGPTGTLELPTAAVDWEVELAVVIGAEATRISQADVWSHVAGLTAAQDFSARDVQLAGGSAPQFSLGKSFAGFTPLGPVLVSPDELENRNALVVECAVNGEVLQHSTTSDLIFDVEQCVSYLSHIVTLRPGDVILTGTPSGVGLGFKPPRYLAAGDVVTTRIEGIGEMTHTAVAPAEPFDAAAILSR